MPAETEVPKSADDIVLKVEVEIEANVLAPVA